MSTRATLSYGGGPDDYPAHHLFGDLADPRPAVYLELHGPGVDFEVAPLSVTVRIPAAVWNRIIEIGKVDTGSLREAEAKA